MTTTTKTYTRIENHREYVAITDVDSDGNYYQRDVWDNGIVVNERRTTLFEMGWKSAREFLQEKPMFKLTGC